MYKRQALGKALGCKVVEISALKGTGIEEAAEAAIHAAQNTKTIPQHSFSGVVEHAIAHIEEVAVHTLPEEQQRFFAIKIFERDEKIIEQLGLTQDNRKHIETDIEAAEKELDDEMCIRDSALRHVRPLGRLHEFIRHFVELGFLNFHVVEADRQADGIVEDVYKRQMHMYANGYAVVLEKLMPYLLEE